MSETNQNFDLWMPCFSCFYGHSCKYYFNAVWCSWILKNGVCPAFTYPYDSLIEILKQEKKEKEKKQEQDRYFNAFNPFKK